VICVQTPNGDKHSVGLNRCHIGKCLLPMGFQLAPSNLTLDDLKGSKINDILFDVKYVENNKSYDVGPIGFHFG